MNRLLSILILIVWGVWLGSLIGVLIAVTSLDHTFREREYFFNAANGVFTLFEQVQLGFAGASLIFAFAWRLGRGAAGIKTAVFVIFALATVSSIVETSYVAPQIRKMHDQSQTHTDAFKAMHGVSRSLYAGSAAALLVGGMLIPFAIAGDEKRRPRGE